MNPEAGITYNFTFKEVGRNQARQLAYELAKTRGHNRGKALLHSLEAFLGKRVKVAADELLQGEFAHIDESLKTLQNKKLIARVATSAGFDHQRIRGGAKQLSRQIVVRTWPYKGLNSPGHASLSIKDSKPESGPPKHKYLSWWPNGRYPGLLGRVMKVFSVSPAINHGAYREDKDYETSDQTIARLMAGAGDFDALKQSERFTAEEKKKGINNPVLPRARQVPIRGTKLWGTQADKVYIPPYGTNRHMETGSPHFLLFGLNESKMDAYVSKLKRSALLHSGQYNMVDPHKNCSGTVLDALKEAGADMFIDTNNAWLISDPNIVHNLAVRLQERLESLNQQVSELDTKFTNIISDPELALLLAPNKAIPGMSVSDMEWPMDDEPGLSGEFQHQIQMIKRAISHFERPEKSMESLIPKAVVLMEAIQKGYQLAGEDEQATKAMAPALNAFRQVYDQAARLCTLQHPKSMNVTPDPETVEHIIKDKGPGSTPERNIRRRTRGR